MFGNLSTGCQKAVKELVKNKQPVSLILYGTKKIYGTNNKQK